MPIEHTQQQSQDEQRKARELSLQRARPPIEVPGYEIHRFLGAGAYGEVWAGIDRNTSRQVAIKFYTHTGGVDWTLLSREVEKLVFLSADRYIVQLLDVGWDSDPRYYVMEYLEHGSLEELLQKRGSLPVGEALAMFREIAVGLLHSHGKGVLHCDLKPANILLDQDEKPRLADFGQSRLSNEQTPALGTLFYMAPEQADLEAMPDARWDVYALGAIFYCLLTGQPPYRADATISELETTRDLSLRLAKYRAMLRELPPPDAHRRVPGVDKLLAEIIDRCLAVDPTERFQNIQGVLDALVRRDTARARRPLMLLGLLGPMVLLTILAVFGINGYRRSMRYTEHEIADKVQQTNRFAAKAVADRAGFEIERYFVATMRAAETDFLPQWIDDLLRQPDVQELWPTLSDPNNNKSHQAERKRFVEHPARQPLQDFVDGWIRSPRKPIAASWTICSDDGTQLAAAWTAEEANQPDRVNTIGANFAWRTYFHGGPDDLVHEETRDGQKVKVYEKSDPDRHIDKPFVSAPFRSKATDTWKVAISAPIYDQEGRFKGIVTMSVKTDAFLQFEEGTPGHFAVLVDCRRGTDHGVILRHPLIESAGKRRSKLMEEVRKLNVDLTTLLSEPDSAAEYEDPLGQLPEGQEYDCRWIAGASPVLVEQPFADQADDDKLETGLVVLVQANYERAMAPLRALNSWLFWQGNLALIVVILVTIAMWYSVVRFFFAKVEAPAKFAPSPAPPPPMHSRETMPAPPPAAVSPVDRSTELFPNP